MVPPTYPLEVDRRTSTGKRPCIYRSDDPPNPQNVPRKCVQKARKKGAKHAYFRPISRTFALVCGLPGVLFPLFCPPTGRLFLELEWNRAVCRTAGRQMSGPPGRLFNFHPPLFTNHYSLFHFFTYSLVHFFTPSLLHSFTSSLSSVTSPSSSPQTPGRPPVERPASPPPPSPSAPASPPRPSPPWEPRRAARRAPVKPCVS